MALTKIAAAGLTAELIDETKLADDSIDSEDYNDGSIDNAHLADDAVGVDELSATGTAGSTTYLRGDNSWTVPPDTNTTYSVGDGGLTQNNFTNTLKTKLDGIEASATADQTGAQIKTAYEAESDTNAFTDADHTKLDGIAASANNYVHPNHSGDVTSTADGATVIAAGAVDIAMLATGTDGKIITWDANGAPTVVGPGTDGQVLTSTGAGSPPAFEAASGGIASLVADTSPQLGGDLDTNDFEILLDDGHKVKFGGLSGGDLTVYHNGSNTGVIDNITGNLNINCLGGNFVSYVGDEFQVYVNDTEYAIRAIGNGGVHLYYDASKKLETTSGGATLTGKLIIGAGMAAHDDANDFVISNDAAISGLSINNADNGYGCINFGDASDNDIGRIAYNHNGNHMTFAVNAGTRMEIEDTGDVKINDGNLIIGTSGHGIDFAATSDATGKSNELFDDYEEGTWTPTVNNGSATFDSGENNYTKIGRMVYLNFSGVNFTDTSTSSAISITGIPFAPAEINYGACSMVEMYHLGGGLAVKVGNNGSNLEFIVTNVNYTQTHCHSSSWDSSTNKILASIAYLTNS